MADHDIAADMNRLRELNTKLTQLLKEEQENGPMLTIIGAIGHIVQQMGNITGVKDGTKLPGGVRRGR